MDTKLVYANKALEVGLNLDLSSLSQNNNPESPDMIIKVLKTELA